MKCWFVKPQPKKIVGEIYKTLVGEYRMMSWLTIFVGAVLIHATHSHTLHKRNERIDFYFLLDAKNWTNAVDNCAIKNGFLAIITNIDEFNTTLDLFADNYSYVYDSANLSYAMVGFYRLDGQYVNVKGDPMLSTFYNRWAEGEPSVSGDCGAMDIDGGLHLVPCDHKYGFICEYITI